MNIEEIKKLNRYKIASEVILPNRIYDEIIETVNLGKVLEILDNQPDFKSAFEELKKIIDDDKLPRLCNLMSDDSRLNIEYEIKKLEQKYKLGGE